MQTIQALVVQEGNLMFELANIVLLVLILLELRSVRHAVNGEAYFEIDDDEDDS